MIKPKKRIEELAIEVGDKCNFNCKHCGIGKSRNLRLSSQEITLLIQSIAEYGFKELLFVGGETTLYVKEINQILGGLSGRTSPKVTITTNGYFAESKTKAKKMLSSIKKLDVLQLSYDKYHCKFLPFERVENLKAACADLKIGFFVLTAIQDPMDLVLLKKLWKLGDIPVGISKILPIGNAKDNGLAMRYPCFDKKILGEKCPGSGRLVYLCGRGFSTCCSILVKKEGTAALVGCTVSDYVKSQFYSLISNKSFSQIAKKFNVSVEDLPSECSNACVLCERIFTNRGKLRVIEAS